MASLNNPSSSSYPFPNLSQNTDASAMLYNGKSNRSRGWKSKKLGDMEPTADSKPLRWPIIKRFDGAARHCSGWDNLGKDPELWFRNGNCYIHLYAKGESQRGPSFLVPFASLLDARCHPLIELFVDRSISETEAFQNGRVDLYIPAPWSANKLRSYWFHLTIRNLFAWALRRSVVGEHLGDTLIALANTLKKYRQPGTDNMRDFLAYLDEEGYMDMREQPTHALAILRFSETYEMSDLYLEAFAHCAGMSERLHKHNEYSRISSASRKLIQHARVDMDFRLSRTGTMLSDLLLEELSDTHMGLPAAAREHLGRFRTYIHGFYATRFGSYPPGPSNKKCRTIFKPEVYRIMRADFAALYEYLADHNFTTAVHGLSAAQGGLCTLQLVQEFDCRHKFVPLPHPVPLLPESVKVPDARKRSSIAWLVGGPSFREAKGRPGQRLLSYASLMKATNHYKAHVLKNRLVIAYRQFEEDTLLATHKAEHTERLSVGPTDARKVRWLFIYAVYQTLLSCAEAPSKLNSHDGLGYHLNISTSITLPWDSETGPFAVPDFENRDTLKSPTVRPAERDRVVSPIPLLPQTEEERPGSELDIKPDVDYFALTHPKDDAPSTGSVDSGATTRTMSLTRSLSIRKPLARFRSVSPQKPKILSTNSCRRASVLPRKSSFHEIIVHGYGNGTHAVRDSSSGSASSSEGSQTQPSSPKSLVNTRPTATRSLSTSSRSSYQSAQSRSSAVQSEISSTPTSPLLPLWRDTSRSDANETQSDASTLYEHSLSSRPSYTDLKSGTITMTMTVRSSSLRKTVRNIYSNDDMLLASPVTDPPPLPRRSSKRLRRAHTDTKAHHASQRWSMVDVSAALREEAEEEEGTTTSGSDYGSSDDGVTDAESVLHPQPLRIRKAAGAVTATTTEVSVAAAAQEYYYHPTSPSPASMEATVDSEVASQISDDWEHWALSGVIAAPPCAWEQFYDLGGLQPACPPK